MAFTHHAVNCATGVNDHNPVFAGPLAIDVGVNTAARPLLVSTSIMTKH